MIREIHNFAQGSEEWLRFRLEHHGASEAAAMLGLSKHVTRSELLAMKHSGLPKEFSDFVQERILDRGHEYEALARPIAEEILVDELYPATYSYGKLSASCDGLTMDGVTAWEHKQWNRALADSVARGIVPEEHMPQCQQVLLVTGAAQLLFMVSDGTRDGCCHTMVLPDPLWHVKLVNGWNQFDADLATYEPPEYIPAAVAEPVMSLPALSIQVNGSITLVDNLKVFGDRLKEFIEGIDKNPSDDQAFANAESAVKTLQAAQDGLEQAEKSALAQTASIDEMRRTVALYADQARSTRLMLEKLIKSRKEAIRLEIVASGKSRLAEHIASLNKRIGKTYLPDIPADFAGVIKGKKTIASLRDAVDTELARAKIATNEIADRIHVNLNALQEHAAEHPALFADLANIVTKQPDDFLAVVKSRVLEFTAAEERRREAERARIREEEQEKLRREEAARADASRFMDEAQRNVPQEPPASPTKPHYTASPSGAKRATHQTQRPSDEQMIAVLAKTYFVDRATVIGWLPIHVQTESARKAS